MDNSENIAEFYKSPEIQSKILRFKNQVEDFFKLNSNLYKSTLPIIHTVKSRLKSDSSLKDKIKRKEKEGKIIDLSNFTHQITDLVGIRVLHLHLKQFSLIHEEILNQIKNDEWEFYEDPKAYSWDDGAIKLYESLGIKTEKKDQYTSVHYVVRVKNNDKNPIYCEIQVRTLFEEVWGEIDHAINYPYKTESVACKGQLTILSKIVMTSGGVVDSIFASLEEYNKLQSVEPTIENSAYNDFIHYSNEALADRYYRSKSEDDDILRIISNLKIQNWYTSQNPAIDLLYKISLNSFKEDQGNADKFFVLGRNIYQAACGNAVKAIDFLKNLNSIFIKLSDFVIQHIYSGMFYEVYFDSQNKIRAKSKSNYLDELYILEKDTRLSKSISFIRSAVENSDINFIILPNRVPEEVKTVISYKSLTDSNIFGEIILNEILSIIINDRELISKNEAVEPMIRVNTKELISILSHKYVIPKYKIQIEEDLDNLFFRYPNALVEKL